VPPQLEPRPRAVDPAHPRPVVVRPGRHPRAVGAERRRHHVALVPAQHRLARRALQRRHRRRRPPARALRLLHLEQQRQRGRRVVRHHRQRDRQQVRVAGPAGLVLRAPHVRLGPAALRLRLLRRPPLTDQRDLGRLLRRLRRRPLLLRDLLLLQRVLGRRARGLLRRLLRRQRRLRPLPGRPRLRARLVGPVAFGPRLHLRHPGPRRLAAGHLALRPREHPEHQRQQPEHRHDRHHLAGPPRLRLRRPQLLRRRPPLRLLLALAVQRRRPGQPLLLAVVHLLRQPVVPELEVPGPAVLLGPQDRRPLEVPQDRVEVRPHRHPRGPRRLLRQQRARPVGRHQVILEQTLRRPAQRPQPRQRVLEVALQDRLGRHRRVDRRPRARRRPLVKQRPTHDLREGRLHLRLVDLALPRHPHLQHQRPHHRRRPRLRRRPVGRPATHRPDDLPDRHRPQAKPVLEQAVAPAGPVAEAAEVVLAHRHHQVQPADRPLREAVEPVEERLHAGHVALREQQLLDLIEVDQDRPVRATKRLPHRPLDRLVAPERRLRRRQLELRVQRVQQPRHRLLVRRPAVDRHVAKVVVLVELGDHRRLHHRRLARARRPEQRHAAVRQDHARQLVPDRLAPVEAAPVARAIRLRPRERVDDRRRLAAHRVASRSAVISVSAASRITAKCPAPGSPAPRFSQISSSSWPAASTARLPTGGGR
jgi:hypothetical protein